MAEILIKILWSKNGPFVLVLIGILLLALGYNTGTQFLLTPLGSIFVVLGFVIYILWELVKRFGSSSGTEEVDKEKITD